MNRSLRGQLQIWYGVVLLAAVCAFATAVFAWTRHNKFEQIDGRLCAAAEYLDVVLRTVPPIELIDRPRPPGRRRSPPRELDVEGGPPPPEFSRPPRPPEVWLGELMPPGWEDRGGGPARPYFAIWRDDGRLVKAAGWRGEVPPMGGDFPYEVDVDRFRDEHEVRRMGPQKTRILVGMPIGPAVSELHRFAWLLAALGAAVAGIGLVGGWIASARLVRPIAEMSEAAAAITAVNLSRRLDVAGASSELAGLAGALNDTFDRLQAAFVRQAAFTADASHELRTPLAVLRSGTQLALNRPRSPEEYREALGSALKATERMTGTVDGLLALARLDGGTAPIHKQVKLDALVRDAVEALRPLAERSDVCLFVHIEPIGMIGDADGLTRVATNLVENAIRYNRTGGEIHVQLGEADGLAELTVRDTGAGIPTDDLPHVFERFYRVDKARARSTGGSGLGLAICRGTVLAHGGTIDVTSTVGEGTTFRVRLPIISRSEMTT